MKQWCKIIRVGGRDILISKENDLEDDLYQVVVTWYEGPRKRIERYTSRTAIARDQCFSIIDEAFLSAAFYWPDTIQSEG